MQSRGPDELRVLIATAVPRDDVLTAECLAAEDIGCISCPTDDALFEALERGAGAVVAARERLTPATVARLRSHVARQQAWSDLPIIVLATASNGGIEGDLEALDPLANVTVIERPARRRLVMGAVRASLRARERQYEARALLSRLADIDRRKDAFIAMLGHELRNPLAAIHGAAGLLESTPDVERLRRISGVIGRQVGNLQRLVDDLLDVARISAGKIVLQRRRVEVRDATRHVVTMLDELARVHRHRLELDVCEEEVSVDADPVRLEQMIGNVVHNAIKYTPDGGTIRVSVERRDGRAVVRVSDTGRGLPPEMIDRIFDHFMQIDSSIDRSMGGLGLGLPLVRGLTNLHGGTVEARSDGRDRGSEFVIALPLATISIPAPESEPVVLTSESLKRARGLRVLLVDDIHDVLDVLRLGLEARGCHVDTATDGARAVERACSGGYDIAFMDIGLPVMDGLAAARAIRSSERTERLPLVAMSGYGREEDRRRSVAAGFDHHLVKPVDARRLLQTAAELLGALDRTAD